MMANPSSQLKGIKSILKKMDRFPLFQKLCRKASFMSELVSLPLTNLNKLESPQRTFSGYLADATKGASKSLLQDKH